MATINPLNNTATPTFTVDKIQAQKEALRAQAAGNLVNPMSQLDKDAFMKLLLTELEHQDPTEPMDTAKMLEQTSQLATLEMQQNTNKVMQDLTKQMQGSLSMTAMSALGKMANLSNSISKDTPNSSVTLNINLQHDAKSGNVEIYNSTMDLVKTIAFDELKAGLNKFIWDGTDNSGALALPGEYLVKAHYTDSQNKPREDMLGSYPVEAVKFVDGKAQVKIGGEYVSIDKVREFTQPSE